LAFGLRSDQRSNAIQCFGFDVGFEVLERGNLRHGHEYNIRRDVNLPAGKNLIPGVISHATDLVEHPELVADRILAFADIVGQENVIAAPTAAYAAASVRKSLGPSSAPCATAR
jgi:5-methyltetrahydropteroyltriglutamate--homocysteine methyltransferase